MAVEPSSGLNNADVDVVVRGDWFVPLVVRQIGGGGGVRAEAAFRVFIGDAELRNVRWVDTGTLQATVPRGVPAGLRAVVVQGPFGSGTLENAYEARLPRPAALSIESLTVAAPQPASTIERGQPFTVTIRVRNTGDLPAAGVRPAPAQPTVSTTGTAAATTTASPSPVSLAGGDTASFAWPFAENGTGPGTLSLSAGATGSDASSGATIDATAATAGPVAVVTAPSLSASSSVLPSVPPGAQFDVTLAVSNSGGAGAHGLSPSLVLGGSTGTTIVAGPVPANADAPAGGSGSFRWTLHAGSVGSLTIDASANGTDALTGAALSTSAPRATTAISEVQPLAGSDPFGDGTSFTFVAPFQGQIWLGPSRTGGGGVRMNPDGSGLQSVSWTIEVDSLPASPARNLAYLPASMGGQGLTCHTMGVRGCAPNSIACGPDNEASFAYLFSGAIAGVEWLGLTSANDPGGSHYLYMTRATFFPPGGAADFAWVDLRAANTAASILGLIAPHVFRDRLYLGYADGSGNALPGQQEAPFLSVVSKQPSLPGFDGAAGTDVANLGAKYIPRLGSVGTPPNTTSIQSIDAIADFDDTLYLGNNGGIVASTTNAPLPCTSSSCGQWVDATPSNPEYTAKVSLMWSVAIDLRQFDRAIPGFAALSGKLYAARTTATTTMAGTTIGPQLWGCSPSGGPGAPKCRPTDWTLIAPNTAGDLALSQFNDANNTAVGLIAAASSSLYVGFHNATTGVQVFRGSGSPLVFTGRGGCAAGTPGCAGLGGNGFGVGVQRIYSTAVAIWNGQESVFVVAGTPPAAARVFRISP